MNKGFIIGMTGLALGSAILGGVGGYFIKKATNKDTVPVSSDVVLEEKYNYYTLPSDFNFVGFDRYALDENVDLFSSSSLSATYFVNKKTKEFNFLCSGSSVKFVKVSENKFLIHTTKAPLFVFDTENFKINNIDLGINNGSSFAFLDSCDDYVWFSFSDIMANVYLFKFDLGDFSYEKYTLTSSCSGRRFVVLEKDDNILLLSRGDSGTYSSFVINKSSDELTILSNFYFFNTPVYFMKDSKVYCLVKYSSSYSIVIFDFEDLSVTKLPTDYSFSNTDYKAFLTENGAFLLASYGSSYRSCYISFSDNSVITIGFYCHLVANDKLYFSNCISDENNSSYQKPILYSFNEDTKSLDNVFSGYSVTNSSVFDILEFNNSNYLHYKSSQTHYYFEFTIDKEGKKQFKSLSMNGEILKDESYKLDDNSYLFYSSGLHYYDFKSDTYIFLKDIEVCSLERNDNIVTICSSDNYIYEFNVDTLSCSCVGYFEEVNS